MSLRNTRRQKGAALVEYGLLVAGVALVATAAVAIFGTKTSDLIASIATVLPGAHAVDNGPITSGQLIETTDGQNANPNNTPIELDIDAISTASGTTRLGDSLGMDIDTLVLDSNK
jgi:Flp pilus assembly pilin Flp